jgi:hypothetical protein
MIRLFCNSEKFFDQIDITVHDSRSAYRRPQKTADVRFFEERGQTPALRPYGDMAMTGVYRREPLIAACPIVWAHSFGMMTWRLAFASVPTGSLRSVHPRRRCLKKPGRRGGGGDGLPTELCRQLACRRLDRHRKSGLHKAGQDNPVSFPHR